MSRRSSSLNNFTNTAIQREINSKYDVVKNVAEHINDISLAATQDWSQIVQGLNEALDFSGITVKTTSVGNPASWDPNTATLTVPVVKGDKGDKGDDGANGYTPIYEFSVDTDGNLQYTVTGYELDSNLTNTPTPSKTITNLESVVGDYASNYIYSNKDIFKSTIPGPMGPPGVSIQGPKGDKGEPGKDLSIKQIISNGDGTFTWEFSDNTFYITPNLKGPKGDKGEKGNKGDQGISVHHLKGTNTTDPEGDFGTSGELDTYTLYGDADETINLGSFTVANGESAYNYAVERGFTGTEEEFTYALQRVLDAVAAATDAENARDAAQVAQQASENARDQAASIFDQFDNIYLGSYSSDLTTDNDGNSLSTGALYFNTTDNVLKIYDGSSWVAPETVAQGYANDAQTYATNAASSATDAANSATAASTSANNASNSSNDASNSANAASISATNAANSASDAAATKNAVDAIYNSFNNIYLGTYSVDPTVDNNGNVLTEGDLYFNSSDKVLKYYNGSSWVSPETISINAASNAQTYAQNAANSANDAANSAVAASNSATAASTSETNTANIYNNFDNRYLGPKSSAPSTDNDGNSLLVGALYWDTTDSKLYLWDGNTWEYAAFALDKFVGIDTVQTVTNKTIDDIGSWISSNRGHFKAEASENISAGTLVKGVSYDITNNVYKVAIWHESDNVPVIGIVENSISLGNTGLVINTGQVVGIDTSNLSESSICYPVGNGSLTTDRTATSSSQGVGYVLRSDSTNGVILVNLMDSIEDASTTKKGIVRLNDTLASTSVEEALTANQGKALNDRLDTAENKLLGIEDNATADQTPDEILTAIKTVDGSGSGLDADLLGGKDSSEFALVNGDSTNTFKVADATSANEALSKGQLLNEIKAVDGAGSGLDADLLDGQNAQDLKNYTIKMAIALG